MDMRKSIKYALDPVEFARSLEFEPDAWQSEALRYDGAKLVLNCSRQSGKSSVAALRCLHRAIYYPNSLILLGGPSLRQSGGLLGKVTDFMKRIPDEPVKIEDNKLSFSLQNGSRVVSLPSTEQTVRGYSSPALIVIDEAARVDDNLYFSLRPMLAVGNGQLVVLSTPFGRRGFFHSIWKTEDASWKKIKVTAEQCPRITAQFLEEEKKILGDYWFKSEYMCEFMQTVDSVFNFDDIVSAVDYDLETWAI